MGTLIAPSRFRNALAIQYNGVDEYSFTDNPPLMADTQGSIMFNYRPTTVLNAAGARGIIAGGVNSAANNSRWAITQRFSSTGTGAGQPRLSVDWRLTHNAAVTILLSNTILAANTSYRVAITSDAMSIRMYINGNEDTVLVNSGSNNGRWFGHFAGTDKRMVLGCLWLANSPSNYSDMQLDEVIYVGGRRLLNMEATQWHNGGVASNPHKLMFASALDHWWRMGDSRDVGSTIFDEIGSTDLTNANVDASNYISL